MQGKKKDYRFWRWHKKSLLFYLAGLNLSLQFIQLYTKTHEYDICKVNTFYDQGSC